MIERIYISFWGIYFIALALVLVMGLLSGTTILGFGLVLFGLIFMGMIAVLPHWASHNHHLHH